MDILLGDNCSRIIVGLFAQVSMGQYLMCGMDSIITGPWKAVGI